MEIFKDILMIVLALQLLTCVLAYSGHPDAETIDFGSSFQPPSDQVIIEAAIKRGMDGEAVAELLRTKKPVVKTVTTPGGATKTTTYKLEDDGSISSKTVTQKRNRYVYNAVSIPDSIPFDELRKSPTGTITRTFTDDDGNKVTQTIALSQSQPSTVVGTDELGEDWFNKPFPAWSETPISSSVQRTITRTFTGPDSERQTVESWSSDPEIPLTSSRKTPTYKHRTISRTYSGPTGEKHIIHTTSNNPDASDIAKKPRFPSISNEKWISFDSPPLSNVWNNMNIKNSDDWMVVEGNPDVETTTKQKVEYWTPKAWNWPQLSTTTTTAKPKIQIEPEVTTRKPLPNLEEFLKSQYRPAATTMVAKTTTNIPKSVSNLPTPSPTSKKTTLINIDDLPVTEILYNGKPADESIIKKLPPHLIPKLQSERVLKIEHKKPVEENLEIYSPKVETNIRTYSKTHNGPKKPSIYDLDPEMQEALKKAGISSEDITNIEGDTITKTRTEPDGRIITTTYQVKSVPSTPVVHTASVQHSTPQVSTHSFYSHKSLVPPSTSHLSQISPISEFLAKLGLTKFDISSRNGELTKTFIDANGDILTATFVLSSPKGKMIEGKPKEKPLK